MCEPATLAATAMAVSGGINAYGQYQQGKFMEEQADYNAQVAEQNAEAAEVAGGDRAADIRERGRAIRSRQRSVGAATGLEVGSGTSLDLLMDTAMGSELDAQTAIYNSQQDAYGLRLNAGQLRRQGKMDSTASKYRAGGTLLSSAAQGYGLYSQG